MRRDISGDDFHQSVDRVYNEMSLLGFESNSLIETDCQVISIANTKRFVIKLGLIA